MSDTDHLFIERAELKQLSEILRAVPDLALDLQITITKQARIGRGVGGRKRKQSTLDPIHFDASKAADELHNELVGWVRLVCEQRAMELPELAGTPKVARWLNRYIISLAMTEGSETAPAQIKEVFDDAMYHVCPPPEKIIVDDRRVEKARRQRLNASGIATLAKELGEEYRNLSLRRVVVLKDAGVIKPVPGPWHPDWPTLYLVGDVLDAHLSHAIRKRHAETKAS